MNQNCDEIYRYKITIEYCGTMFCGWQKQQSGISIQGAIECAIEKLTKQKVNLCVAGRTDAGVHAYNQVAHFDLNRFIDPYKFTAGINHFLKPNKIGIKLCEVVDNEFNARFSAIARHYVYKIVNRKEIIVISDGFYHWVREKIDIDKMIEASKYLIGHHDFNSFRSSRCQAKSSFRTLSNIDIFKTCEDEINIYVSAPSFLHHMVRNIVGTLLPVGLGKIEPKEIEKILQGCDRNLAGPTAPAHGLYLLKIDY